MSATIGLWEHFKRLFDFNGREDRASFWPYAGVAFIIIMVVGMLILVPMMGSSIAASHDPQLFSAHSMALYLAVTFGLAVLLYSAAVVRRLHDRGKSGVWGLMPLPFIVYSSVMMPRVFASAGEPNIGLFFSIFISNMLYIVTLIWLIVLLAGLSEPAPNRYDAGA